MLSFGHSAYYGLGAFAALHLMKAVEEHVLAWPTPLIPLAGATAGLLVRHRVRLVRNAAHGRLLRDGDAGAGRAAVHPGAHLEFPVRRRVPASRPCGCRPGALSFGNDTHVYYLTLAWVALSAWCLWAFTGTPMGRLALAMRENEHRLRFLGFNTHLARTLVFAISAMFTGVAGALLAIANEASNYTIFSAQASANVVLQTFIGGAGTFFGPALGAAVMTFFARVTSDLTRSWLLYQGLIFVLVMLFVPDGIGGLVSMHARRLHGGAMEASRRCPICCASRSACCSSRASCSRSRASTWCCRMRTRAQRRAAGGGVGALPAVRTEIRSIVAADVGYAGGAFYSIGGALLPLAKRRDANLAWSAGARLRGER